MQKNTLLVHRFACLRDDLTIRGTLYRPAVQKAAENRVTGVSSDGTAHTDACDRTSQKLPIAILSHGFMANQKMMTAYAKTAAALGYAAFTFDFCGGCIIGKSDGKTTEMSVLTEMKDLEAVIAFAAGQPFTDAANIALIGASQGGFVSALTAAKYKEKIAKLVLFYPALCIPDDARKGHMMFAKFDPQQIPPIIRCGPMTLGRIYPEDVLPLDPFTDIAPYKGPVLILHGTDDDVVNISYARRAAECYADCRLVEIPNAKHGFSKADDRIALPYLRNFLQNTYDAKK